MIHTIDKFIKIALPLLMLTAFSLSIYKAEYNTASWVFIAAMWYAQTLWLWKKYKEMSRVATRALCIAEKATRS